MKAQNATAITNTTTNSDSNETRLKLLKSIITEESKVCAITLFLKKIVSLFNRKNDLTFEEWQRLEAKPQKSINTHNKNFK